MTASLEDQATSQDILAAARADYARLVGVLYARGYYGPVVRIDADGQEVATMSPFAAPSHIGRITINVDPGPQFRFGDARVTPLAPGAVANPALAWGEVAASTALRDAAGEAVEGWRDAGHAKAQIDSQHVTANHPAAQVNARVSVAPGPRLRFGDLVPDTSSRVLPERQAAIAGLPAGAVFSPAELDAAAERLRRTGAFRAVVLREGDAQKDNTLPIALEVTDAKRRRYGLGAEYASQEGLALSAFWLHRNLLGGAERLTVDGLISGIGGQSGGEDFNLSVTLARPATFTPDTQLLLEAELETLNEPDFENRSAALGIALNHQFNDRLQGRVGARLRYSDPKGALAQSELLQLFVPIGATWDTRNNDLSASSGLFADVEVMPFATLNGGGGGLRFASDLRGYRNVGDIVFAGRAQFGSILGATQSDLPPDLLFLSGGGGTVRGQTFQSLGVDLPMGTVGGRSFAGLSIEARVRASAKLGIVAFADLGFVSASGTFDAGRSHSGAGLGLRYDTGIGPIRLDVAVPTSGDTGSGLQIYVGIGQAF
ncbi:autotransporter assembly complex protein TamA [Actibacterium mucosum]|uniref:autotransporter assembly complex protein TamA n=1 Tax=Actibacterium mucosum TaxID=1087332 RepID=UPI001F00519E|nr:BamA/TamA family outer membrane protein [Actibacterium mucosum]